MSPQINLPNPNKDVTVVEPSFATKLFASALYSGYSPIASGTAGSAVALVFYIIPGFESLVVIGTSIFIVFILGISAAGAMELRYGHDPAEVTIDEVLGMWISLVLLPKNIFIIVPAFFIFRLFDIIKPFPARKFDAMYGGFGIMMDDVIAGIYTNIILRLVLLIPVMKEVLVR
jgi:phosphatidylglycerophosphatase A